MLLVLYIVHITSREDRPGSGGRWDGIPEKYYTRPGVSRIFVRKLV